MNLLFSINKNCMHLLQTCLKSIELHGGAANYEVYILHSDLDMEDQNEILEQGYPCMTYHFISIPKELFAGFPTTKRYPEQIYYRLAAPALLPNDVDRILYLDVDTIIINSLQSLYESDFEENWFMACSNTGTHLTRLNRVRLGVDIAQNIPYVNTGVLLMNLEQLRIHMKLEDIRAYANQKQDILILPDQDILTALYGEHVKLLDRMIYNLSDRTLLAHNADLRNQKVTLTWVRQNSVIIHYFGRNKPWKARYAGILDVFYHEITELLQPNDRRKIG